VFYFGILADDTPPVGLAAYAAAAIARSDPIKTGIQGFTYDIRTAVLPFMFIFNTELLLIGVEGPFHLLMTVLSATGAMLIFAAATQGYWLVKSRWYETALLLLVAFSMFRPGFWWDEVYPPLETKPAVQIEEIAGMLPENRSLRLAVAGDTIDGNYVKKIVELELGGAGDGAQRLQEVGLMLSVGDEKVMVDMVGFDSAAQKAGIDFGWEILAIETQAERPPKQLVYIPVLILLAGLAAMQLRRRKTA
jgi:hypothetical protein